MSPDCRVGPRNILYIYNEFLILCVGQLFWIRHGLRFHKNVLSVSIASNVVLKLGENILIKNVQLIKSAGQLVSYVHMNGKIGVTT